MRQGDFAAMPKFAPDALLEEVAVVAKPAERPSKLRQRYKGILHRVSLYFPILEEGPEAEWKQFVDAFRGV